MADKNTLERYVLVLNDIQRQIGILRASIQAEIDYDPDCCEEQQEEERSFYDVPVASLPPVGTVVTLSGVASECGIGTVGDTAVVQNYFHNGQESIKVIMGTEFRIPLLMLTGKHTGCVTRRTLPQISF